LPVERPWSIHFWISGKFDSKKILILPLDISKIEIPVFQIKMPYSRPKYLYFRSGGVRAELIQIVHTEYLRYDLKSTLEVKMREFKGFK